MFTLRLTQYADNQPDYYRIEIALEGDGSQQTAISRFRFKLTPQEQESIRWYLEDYLQYLFDPAPQIAAKVEQRIMEIGVELFKAIFHANDDARNLWATLSQNLNRTRVEILTDVAQATAIPWEFLCEPNTGTYLTLQASAFVRSYLQTAQLPQLPQTDKGSIRILLVICRPRGREDIPFRSVASRLIKGLGTRPDGFQLDVLRPPTFEQLRRVLLQAKLQGKPYHVVHFDGHGVFLDLIAETSGTSPDSRKMRGYLMFENPEFQKNQEFIHGKLLGEILVYSDVPLLVLNACRSAHAEAPEQPTRIDESNSEQANSHNRSRSFGSLAQEVMNAGVAGVVAMQYNVYVITAAQFVANLYTSLAQGQSLGEAVTFGRKQLRDQPLREIIHRPVTLQDWLVPVVYEAVPIAPFPTLPHTQSLAVSLHENDVLPTTGMLDTQLPKTPDVGFFGRDETLLAIDRAFDQNSIVLLHAFAGSGKTSTASEFGRWYALTGGLVESDNQGVVLFTSFQRYQPLHKVLDKLGQTLEQTFAQSGIQWLALSDDQRRSAALQMLSQIPVLWIWDNVEPVAGFPDGETHRWSQTEQQELADFLQDARNTKAKFLLTSRRDERAWLGDSPVRVQVPPMPMQERMQFTRELAKKHGYHLTEVEGWRPLLKYTQGNPLIIKVVVSQALRNNYRSKEQIEEFIADLRTGATQLEDKENEGKSRALEASLNYGFLHSFDENERRQLALLHLFRDCIQSFTFFSLIFKIIPHEERNLITRSNSKGSNLLNQDLKRVPGLEALLEKTNNLLNKAAEIGLLESLKIQEKYLYRVHPALSQFFKRLFDQYYSDIETSNEIDQVSNCESVLINFIRTMGEIGNFYHGVYIQGNSNIVNVIAEEEENLLYALHLSKTNNEWFAMEGIMQGLRNFYLDSGRQDIWKRLVKEVAPNFSQTPNFEESRLDYELPWFTVTEFLVSLARDEDDYNEAERLQKQLISSARSRADYLIGLPLENLGNLEREQVRTFAVSIGVLGRILRDKKSPDCIKYLEEAIQLCQRIGDQQEASSLYLALGHAYRLIPELRNWEQAIYSYEEGLKLSSPGHHMNNSIILESLGRCYLIRLDESLRNGESGSKTYFDKAFSCFSKALDLTPSSALQRLGMIHSALGKTLNYSNNLQQAISHLQKAIRYLEEVDGFWETADCRNVIADALLRAKRPDEAIMYARSALHIFERYGSNATTYIEKTQRLIQQIVLALTIEGDSQ